MAETKTALIVGASRGLGLGLVKTYRGRGWRVNATVREAADEAGPAGEGAEVRRLDVRDPVARAELASAMAGETLDLLFLNAGVYGPREVADAEAGEIDAAMQANAFGPVQLAYALIDRVRPKTGAVAFMTSAMGSIAENESGGSDVYRASKAAQNMLAKGLWLRSGRDRGLAVLSVHPGWVRTDMGGAGAPLDVPTSAQGIADQIERRAGTSAHVFVDYSGREIPW